MSHFTSPLARIDWSLRRTALRIRFARAVGAERDLHIYLAVADRLLDERNRITRATTTP